MENENEKLVILASALTLSFGAFAATQASEETLATAHKGADTAKEKLHEAQKYWRTAET